MNDGHQDALDGRGIVMEYQQQSFARFGINIWTFLFVHLRMDSERPTQGYLAVS